MTNAKEAARRSGCRCDGRIGSAARRRTTYRLGDGALDRPGRQLAILHSDGERLRLQARRDGRARAFRASFRRRLLALSRALWGRGSCSPPRSTGVPHVVRMAGSDAGRLWRHPQLEAALRSCVALRRGRDRDRESSPGARSSAAFVPSASLRGGGFEVPENLFTPEGPALDLAASAAEVDGGSRAA